MPAYVEEMVGSSLVRAYPAVRTYPVVGVVRTYRVTLSLGYTLRLTMAEKEGKFYSATVFYRTVCCQRKAEYANGIISCTACRRPVPVEPKEREFIVRDSYLHSPVARYAEATLEKWLAELNTLAAIVDTEEAFEELANLTNLHHRPQLYRMSEQAMLKAQVNA